MGWERFTRIRDILCTRRREGICDKHNSLGQAILYLFRQTYGERFVGSAIDTGKEMMRRLDMDWSERHFVWKQRIVFLIVYWCDHVHCWISKSISQANTVWMAEWLSEWEWISLSRVKSHEYWYLGGMNKRQIIVAIFQSSRVFGWVETGFVGHVRDC